jgi:uncharacterized protein YdeI (YjbR/CyaY-like superfamily)
MTAGDEPPRARGRTTNAPAGRAEYEVKRFASAAAWERWLEKEHERLGGVWLMVAKGDADVRSVSYAEALEIALCFGWIDGQKKAHDDFAWMQKFTPRARRSRWSKINCAKADSLTKAGRMRPAGLRAIEQAKADGRWAAAYASQSRAEVPDDLERALRENPAAQAFFLTIASHNRYAILYRVNDAKKPETRARRIATYVAMLAEHKTLHPDSKPK